MFEEHRALELRRFEFEIEPGRVLRGRVRTPGTDGPWPWVVLVHGFKGFMDWGFFPELQLRLANAGVAVVAFNTSGSGVGPDLRDIDDDESFSRDTCTRTLEDIESVRERIPHEASGAGLDARRVGLVGHSRGGGLGIVHAAERGDYRAVVAWAPIARAVRFDEAARAQWHREGSVAVPNARLGRDLPLRVDYLEDLEAHPARLDIPAAAARLQAPLRVVHGEADSTVEVAEGHHLADAAPHGSIVVVAGAGHTFGAVHPFAGVTPELELAILATLDGLGEL